jgi:hypothetical protein
MAGGNIEAGGLQSLTFKSCATLADALAIILGT